MASLFAKPKQLAPVEDPNDAEARRLERAAGRRRRGRSSTIAGIGSAAEGGAQLGAATLLGR